MSDWRTELEKHLSDTAEKALTGTLTTTIQPERSLTMRSMLQSCLDALAPNDHWRVRSDDLMPLNVPVVRMSNDDGVPEHHIGETAARLMVTKRYCPFQIIDVDAAYNRRGVVNWNCVS